jgi:hypothetical protein
MKEAFCHQKSLPFLSRFFPADICHVALVDESGMVRTQMGVHNRSENGCSAWDALCNITPLTATSNQQSFFP